MAKKPPYDPAQLADGQEGTSVKNLLTDIYNVLDDILEQLKKA